MNAIRKTVTFAGGARGEHNGYEAVSAEPPSRPDIAEWQAELLYHPDGYGGPNGIAIIELADGTFLTTWSSMGSCD